MIDSVLSDIFYNIKSSAVYSSPKQIMFSLKHKGIKIPMRVIIKWLESQQLYTMYKPVFRKKIKSRKIVVNAINELWDIDLADLSEYELYNENVKYLLTVLDVFSRKIYAIPLKNKTGLNIINGLSLLFKNVGIPKKIRSDRGTEFTAKIVQDYLKPLTKQYFATGPQKAAYVESAIKELKKRISKHIIYNNDKHYLDHLQDIVNDINNSYHSGINTFPNNVTKDNELQIWAFQFFEKEEKI